MHLLPACVILLLLAATSACSKPALSHGEPVLGGGKASLKASTGDMQHSPLYDRVDLLLMPGDPLEMGSSFAGSTEYFDAIKAARGFYGNGDYLEDSERESGSATYEVSLPMIPPPQGCRAWLACLRLDGTTVEIVECLPLDGWPTGN